MLARSVQLFLVSVAILAMAPFAATQTVTLGFDGAPDGPLPWSEQGFVFTDASPSECGEALTQEGGNLALHASSYEGPGPGGGPHVSCSGDVTLSRADGGTFDALSLDVHALVSEYSDGCASANVFVSSTKGFVNVYPALWTYGPQTAVLDWTDISHLTVSWSVSIEPSGTCFGQAVLDNFVVNTPQAECLLVIGDGPGAATYFDGDMDHLFGTQLDAVEDAHAVLIDDIPDFVLPLQRGRRDVTAVAPLGNGTLTATPVGDVPLDQPPAWMLDGDFAVQVLMWNPQVFPGQPEQSTAGLYVSIQPDGSVVATPFGTDQGGLQIGHELDTNAAGQRVIRFPFSIPGFDP